MNVTVISCEKFSFEDQLNKPTKVAIESSKKPTEIMNPPKDIPKIPQLCRAIPITFLTIVLTREMRLHVQK